VPLGLATAISTTRKPALGGDRLPQTALVFLASLATATRGLLDLAVVRPLHLRSLRPSYCRGAREEEGDLGER
jgi:hypothetical protein